MNIVSKYQKLRQDFKTPIKALLHTYRLLSGTVVLTDKFNFEFPTNKDDLPIWEEYFESKTCKIDIEKGLFKVTPKNVKQPAYHIKGGYYKITHNPTRFNPEALKSPLFKHLQDSEKKIFSQHGEDGVFDELFKMIPHPHNFVIEFGAHDGVKMSNSRHLVQNRNWRAFLIEASDKLYAELAKVYPNCELGSSRKSNAIQTLKSFVTTENINELFRKAGTPKDFELLSIDVDSIDYYLWEALTDFEPRVVVIESNPIIAPNIEYIAPKETAFQLGGTNLEGASFKSLVELGRKKNYTLVYVELIGSNLFFVHNDYLKYLDGYTPMDPTIMFQPPQFGVLCDGPALNGRGY